MALFPTRRLSRALGLAAVSAAALFAVQVSANTISYTTKTYGDGTAIKGETMQFGAQTKNYSTGALWATESTVANSFWVYCLDPLVSATTPATDTPTGLNAFLGSTAYFGASAYSAASLGAYAKQTGSVVLANLVELYSHAYLDSLTSNTKSAAFQYAVWEILGESATGLGTGVGGLKTTGWAAGATVAGVVQTTAAAANGDTAFVNQANAYLNALVATNEAAAWGAVAGTGAAGATNLGGTTNFTYTVYVPTVGSSQAFLGVVQSTNTNTNGVPEPGSLALAGMAALAFVGARQRKNKAS